MKKVIYYICNSGHEHGYEIDALNCEKEEIERKKIIKNIVTVKITHEDEEIIGYKINTENEFNIITNWVKEHNHYDFIDENNIWYGIGVYIIKPITRQFHGEDDYNFYLKKIYKKQEGDE